MCEKDCVSCDLFGICPHLYKQYDEILENTSNYVYPGFEDITEEDYEDGEL